VLGAIAARRLGLPRLGMRVWLGKEWFAVVGVLDPVPLAPALDSSALIGWHAAQRFLGFDGRPTMVFARIRQSQVEAVQAVLPRTANPESPSEVVVSRPSDALAAQRESNNTLSGLVLGLGAVAVLVGGVGVANTMVISVLERRTEVGLRRALGATRGQIRGQFLTESLLLTLLGGAAGCGLGAAAIALYAFVRSWPVVVPLSGLAAALSATVLLGALAGLYPAVRASRMPPTEALSTP
jgi:putative ABC transport system permease protein